MINLHKFIWFNLFLSLLFGQVHAASKANIATRNFWHPTYQGERLDYCALGDSQCGKVVADQYCKLMGYDYASQQSIAHNVGLTNYLFERARCKGWTCDGFTTIACSKNNPHHPPAAYHYTKKRFAFPRFNHYRVDWCYNDKNKCGRPAAYSFCRRQGYMTVESFARDKAIHASKTIGSQKLCFGESCDGFKYILCRR